MHFLQIITNYKSKENNRAKASEVLDTPTLPKLFSFYFRLLCLRIPYRNINALWVKIF